MKINLNRWNKYYYHFFFLMFITPLFFFIYKDQRSWLFIYLASILLLSLFGFALFKKRLLLYMALLFAPLSIKTEPLTGYNLSFPSEIIAVIFFLALIPILISNFNLTKKIIFHPLSILILIDTVWLLLCSVTSSIPLVSFKRLFMRSLFIQCFYIGIILIIDKKEKLLNLFFLYGIGIICVAFPILTKHLTYMLSPNTSNYACQPFFPEHTVYGACLAFIFPSFLYMPALKKQNSTTIYYFILIAAGFLLLVAEIFSYSRAALLSLLLVFIIYLFTRIRIKLIHLLFLTGISIFAFILVQNELFGLFRNNKATSSSTDIPSHYRSITNLTTDVSNTERINRWVCAFRMFQSKPIFGYGPGTYQFEYGKFQTKEYKTSISTDKGDKGNSHSQYLTCLSETGIIGLLTFLLIIIYSIYLAIKIYKREKDDVVKKAVLAAIFGLLTFYIHSFFNSFLDQDKMAILVYGSLGLLTAIDLNYKNTFSVPKQITG